ncbi:MAG: hypothetical protein U9N12_06770 [Euryarchaeota archaeon]|nr:hypothetical protein [Euryarchaeota archaeon]
MKLATTIVILLLVATITVTFSGCIEERDIAPEPEPLHNDTTKVSVVNLTLLPGIENGLEIHIVSFSSLYMRDNRDEESREWTHNISEWYYAAYNLSIKNNGSDAIDFKVNDLHLRVGDRLFNTTTMKRYNSSRLGVLADLGKGDRIGDAPLSLSPGQTVNGYVIFCADSLYDRSFLLMYGATPVTSASFEESLEALEAAERFDYSQVFGIAPYNIQRKIDSYEPDPEAHPFIWANWVNRSVFEFYKTADFEAAQNALPDNIPVTEIRHAVKVMPERNITVVSGNRLLVIDDFGEELINKSRVTEIVILRNGTYEGQPEWATEIQIPQMNIPDATIVQISFAGICGWAMSMRFSYNDQDVILDDELNIVLARYYNTHLMS